MKYVLIGIVFLTLPLLGLCQAIVGSVAVSIPMTVIMVVAGFLFCSVSGRKVTGVTAEQAYALFFSSGTVMHLAPKPVPNGQRYSNAANAKDRAAWKVVQRHYPNKSEAQCRKRPGAAG
jgi:hypothetical protein